MTGKWKKIAVLLPLSLVVILFLLVLLADVWLESNAGRRELESALEGTLGMPVHLQGEFSISLLPRLGVSGEGLMIGAAGTTSPFIQSSDYHVALELLPLINGKLTILSFRVGDGLLDPAAYAGVKSKPSSPGGAKIKLPEIEHFLLENFRIDLPAGADSSLLVQSLELEAFRAGEPSPLRLELSLQSNARTIASLSVQSTLLVGAGLDQISVLLEALSFESDALVLDGINGRLSWQDEQKLLEGQLSWEETGLGSADLTARMSTATDRGTMELEYVGAGQAQALLSRLDFQQQERGVYFPEILLTLGDQKATGSGCLLTDEGTSVHLLMAAEFIDLEQWASLMPAVAGDGAAMATGTGTELPIDINFKLNVEELLAAGAIVKSAEISSGQATDCSLPQD